MRCIKIDSISLPQLTTNPTTSITSNSAISGGGIISNGGISIINRDVCWDTISNPTINNDTTQVGKGTGIFGSEIKELYPNKEYFVRTYAINKLGVAYGNQVNFITNAELPTLSTQNVSSITATSAVCGGYNINNGGASITSKGVCWSNNPNPTIADNKTIDGSGSGNFVSNITGLTPGTTYYIRSYSMNIAGVGYGNEIVFNTLSVPQLITLQLSNITSNSVNGGGNIVSDGGAAIVSRGLCWKKTPNPTIFDSITSDGSGVGTFSSIIQNLEPGTTYYVRAYAINNIGVGYGNQLSFTTEAILALLTTSNISSISSNSAISGGNISFDGGSLVISRGVCWSTSQNPSLTDNFTQNGAGMGIFSSTIIGLQPATTYYLRAYATNSVGTTYGNQVSFTTTAALATLTTINATSITSTTASSGGNIINNGGSQILSRGVCWSVNQNPTLNDSLTIDGNGNGIFNSSIIGLLPATTYYLRAYATNSIGTSYGNQISFTTLADIPNITTIVITNITSSSAKSGGNIIHNGGSTVISKGVCWSTSQNPTINNYKTTDGSGDSPFLSILTELSYNTMYYVRAYATNSIGTSYGNQIVFSTISPIVFDNSGNGYDTVVIGNQAWFKQNLKTTKFKDNTSILKVSDNTNWVNLTSSGYCWYNNDSINYFKYGALYNWNAVNSSKLCPSGWRVPSSNDWHELRTYLGGENIAGGKIKEIGTLYWSSPNLGATNETGFTALPSGARSSSNGDFYNFGNKSYWWTSTLGHLSTLAWHFDVSYNNTILNSGTEGGPNASANIKMGLSVRCLRNEKPTLATSNAISITPNSAICGGIINNDGGSLVIAKGVCWNTSPNPTINNFKSNDGSGTNTYQSAIPDLFPNTTYYVRAYATNESGTAYGNEINFTTLANSALVYDFDGNSYDTVHIGNQIWFKQNLKTSRYRNGSLIPEVTNNTVWSNTTFAAQCNYNNNASNLHIYGKLYNRFVVENSNNICPKNWHIPTIAEWEILIQYLGGSSLAGGKMKDIGTSLWNSPNTGATNESNFTALPSGSRNTSATFNQLGSNVFWWSAYESNTSLGKYYTLSYDQTSINNADVDKKWGFSIRCISNSSSTLPTVSSTTLGTLTPSSVNIGGNVTNNGGLPVFRGICWSTNPNPTINDNFVEKGIGTGQFYCDITNLSFNTTYYARAYAKNDIGTVYANQISFTTTNPVVFDIDGNGYDTIHIGSQIWMKQNLNTTRFRNGDQINNVTSSWSNLYSSAYCNLNNDTSQAYIYGRIYNGYAVVDSRNLCPIGWHIPSDSEWTILENYLGGSSFAGGKLKEVGLSHWPSPNTNATNESKFTALPGGGRNILVSPAFFSGAYWWSSTEVGTSNLKSRNIVYNSGATTSNSNDKRYGYSIRCIKD